MGTTTFLTRQPSPCSTSRWQRTSGCIFTASCW
jgi:hypothetical protein